MGQHALEGSQFAEYSDSKLCFTLDVLPQRPRRSLQFQLERRIVEPSFKSYLARQLAAIVITPGPVVNPYKHRDE